MLLAVIAAGDKSFLPLECFIPTDMARTRQLSSERMSKQEILRAMESLRKHGASQELTEELQKRGLLPFKK
jgi:hypothetical protein